MEKLYRKIGSEFQEVSIPFYGDPKEGIWFIKKEGTTVRRTWLCKTIEELPENMTWASFLPFKEKVVKALSDSFRKILRRIEKNGVFEDIPPKDITEIIYANLK